MESFIKHQMMVILQPFVDQVQDLDAKIAQLGDRLQRTDNGLANNRAALEATNGDVSELRCGLKESNSKLASLREGIDTCVKNEDMLQQGVEFANGHVARLHQQLEGTEGLVRELQRTSGEGQCELQALRANLQRTSDSVTNDLRRGVDQMGEELFELKCSQSKGTAELEKLKGEVDRNGLLLHDTRKVVDTNTTTTTVLQKNSQEISAREAQLSAKLEGWKQQWSKLHPALEAIRKDTAFLKQGHDHHDSVVHGLQQGYAHTGNLIESLRESHTKLGKDVQSAQQDLSVTQQGVTDLRDGLDRATKFSNDLHTSLQKTEQDLNRTNLKLDGLETRHVALQESFDKTSGAVSELKTEHRKSVSSVQTLHHELEKTNETLCTARNQIDSTNMNLYGLKGDLGRTNDNVQRLDHGVELCQAGFSGLQKGFVETGTHITSRPITLPKLPRGDDHRTPRQLEMSPPSSRGEEHRPSLPKPGTEPTAWIQDSASTYVSSQSHNGSRRSSISGIE